MKKLAILFASMFIMAIAVQNVNAQDDATISDVPAAATIIAPITLSLENAGLNFGNIIPADADGTVAMGTDDIRTPSVVTLQPAVNGQAAEFEVTGLIDAHFTISLPDDDDISLTGVGDPMLIESFIHNSNEILTGGVNNFKVGATLKVNANQAAGLYEGQFPVTVAYN